MQRRPALDDSQPIWRSMLVFLIPLMASNLLQSASSTFTSIFLGRLIGVAALASASSIFPMLFFLISFFIGISSGSTVLIGQAYGAGDTARLRHVAGTTLTFALAMGVVIGAIGLVFTRPILHLIGTPPDVFEGAVAYASVIFASLPLLFIYLLYTTFLRGVGDSRTPFIVLAAVTVFGIALSPLLIVTAGLGVIGAPVANTIASLLGVVGMLVWLERRRNPLALGALRGSLAIDPTVLVQLIRIGIPTGLQLVMVSLAEIAVISFVNRFGFRATAAYGAVNQIVSYVQFPAVSIGIAASIFGSQSIGAGRIDRLGKIVRAGVVLNYVIGGVLIALSYAFDRAIISLFVTDQSTIDIAVGLLRVTLWSYVIFGNTAVLSGMMRSSGVVLWPTLLSFVSIWGVEVPVAWWLSRGSLGLTGVWVAYPVAFVVSLALQYTYYAAVWKRRPIKSLTGPSATS